MEISRKSCRVCLSESEFNVSLFGSYCKRTNMIDKIRVCLELLIEESHLMNTICYKCAENVERYYNFIMFVKKTQTKLERPKVETFNLRQVTSYVKEQDFDADFTFSFLEIPEENKEPKPSSPFFSYFSAPPKMKQTKSDHVWKTPTSWSIERKERTEQMKRHCKPHRPRQNSMDMFESQSQDIEEQKPGSSDWILTPNDNILKRIKDKCFGRSGF